MERSKGVYYSDTSIREPVGLDEVWCFQGNIPRNAIALSVTAGPIDSASISVGDIVVDVVGSKAESALKVCSLKDQRNLRLQRISRSRLGLPSGSGQPHTGPHVFPKREEICKS